VNGIVPQPGSGIPHPLEEPFQPNPRIGIADKWRRIEAIQRLVGFLNEYAECWRRWKAGTRDVVFPFGTYAMRVVHRSTESPAPRPHPSQPDPRPRSREVQPAARRSPSRGTPVLVRAPSSRLSPLLSAVRRPLADHEHRPSTACRIVPASPLPHSSTSTRVWDSDSNGQRTLATCPRELPDRLLGPGVAPRGVCTRRLEIRAPQGHRDASPERKRCQPALGATGARAPCPCGIACPPLHTRSLLPPRRRVRAPRAARGCARAQRSHRARTAARRGCRCT
jgi:hypothetical protein